MIKLFNRKYKILQLEKENCDLELSRLAHQLSQWRKLFEELKLFEWFEIADGNVIIAHDNTGNTKIFTTPHKFKKCNY